MHILPYSVEFEIIVLDTKRILQILEFVLLVRVDLMQRN